MELVPCFNWNSLRHNMKRNDSLLRVEQNNLKEINHRGCCFWGKSLEKGPADGDWTRSGVQKYTFFSYSGWSDRARWITLDKFPRNRISYAIRQRMFKRIFCEMRIRLEEKPLMRGEVLFALILRSHLVFTSHHHHHFLYPLHTPKKRAKAKRVNRVNLLHTSRARGALSTTENRFYFCFRRISISDSFTPSNAINNVAGVGRAENLTHNTSSFGGVTMRWKSQSIFVSCSV